jgi:putative two-component system response regulator
VTRLAELVSLAKGDSLVKARQIRIAAALHDIGKLKIPASLLDKPGKLTAREFDVMKTHTKIGAVMLSTLRGELGAITRTVCEFHHEKMDGTGYWGVRAGDLPDYVAIVSIADVYVACRSVRPYKAAWSERETLDYIKTQAGTQFSPGLAEDFITLIQSDSRVPAIFL